MEKSWVLRHLKPYRRRDGRIRMVKAWEAWHKPTGRNVGVWRDKGEALRWIKSSPEWRKQLGIDGPAGWELRRRKVQRELS